MNELSNVGHLKSALASSAQERNTAIRANLCIPFCAELSKKGPLHNNIWSCEFFFFIYIYFFFTFFLSPHCPVNALCVWQDKRKNRERKGGKKREKQREVSCTGGSPASASPSNGDNKWWFTDIQEYRHATTATAVWDLMKGGLGGRLACMHLPIHSLAGMPAGDTSLVSSARQPGLNQKQAPLSRPLMPSRCGHSCGNELGGYYFNSGRPSVHMRALMTLCGALKRSAGHGKRGEFRRDSREAPLARWQK